MSETKKCIIVDTCDNCPFKKRYSGMGHGESFTVCGKWKIVLIDYDEDIYFDIKSGIHPDCKLTKL